MSKSNKLLDQQAEESSIGCSIALTIPEACQLSTLRRSSIYKAIKNGDLVKRKWGKRAIILREDLEKFLVNLPQG